ncbi:hypothetical protein E2C01_073337 [Portunus trituberculatus]|uniref:Uncharacterized protein n=1 Tax=Portunus trituberculatus TaxID=210409 RepID=A0A5B7IAA7_PORTR|nr:hypothetical protein [Portunus trituberculatus]
MSRLTGSQHTPSPRNGDATLVASCQARLQEGTAGIGSILAHLAHIITPHTAVHQERGGVMQRARTDTTEGSGTCVELCAGVALCRCWRGLCS